MIDISESSLKLARGILKNHNINYCLKNIFEFNAEKKYDFISIGEVLEHVENPLLLLKKIYSTLSFNGVCFLTTPINSPMIDHIYLFKNEDEIRDIISNAGFQILLEKIVITEKISSEKAYKFKAPIMYAAFIKKEQQFF
jgi:2-polyprenyl-3-methyl-5-hydroxy-6-metoxy-1,4-benzoquinol methylase